MPRKNIDLSARTILKLQRLADIEKRKLKPYIEIVLTDYAEKHDKVKNPQLSILNKIKK